jgi:hemin uptake protein HemP
MRRMHLNNLPKPDTPSLRMEVINADVLFRDRRELVIEHRGERYRLSLTKNGKLILTK